jgi:hypothetical protein
MRQALPPIAPSVLFVDTLDIANEQTVYLGPTPKFYVAALVTDLVQKIDATGTHYYMSDLIFCLN